MKGKVLRVPVMRSILRKLSQKELLKLIRMAADEASKRRAA
jgi:hypothetical protein